MSNTILVPLDDSESAWYALEEALKTFEAETIIVLTVIETKEFTHGPEGGAAQSVFEAHREEARELFEKAQRRAREFDGTLEHAIETGNPGTEIVNYAKTHDVDHIVMGSHGRSGISRLLLGSVAEHVLRNAPTSVLIARRNTDDAD